MENLKEEDGEMRTDGEMGEEEKEERLLASQQLLQVSHTPFCYNLHFPHLCASAQKQNNIWMVDFTAKVYVRWGRSGREKEYDKIPHDFNFISEIGQLG